MVGKLLRRRLTLFLTVTVWGGHAFLLPVAVQAETPLTQAVIQSTRNTVRLLQRNQAPRPARVRDAMTPGDALSTARLSLAELRFNDGSLARVGEQALFQFLPKTRNFRLSNGTVLLLIPPGRGQTRIQTPNAATGIRGSALFVRYVPETETTLVGALTTSGIEVANRDRTQNQPLVAGQMAVIVQNRIERVYNFDLRTFYETSNLVQGLSLSGQEGSRSADPAIAAVQEETIAAVEAQAPITGSSTAQNPVISSPPTGTTETQDGSPGMDNRPASAPASTVTPPNPGDLTIPQSGTVSRPSTLSVTGIIQRAGRQPDSRTGTTGDLPGQGRSNPPGLTGTAPGLSGNTPGQLGNSPPGLAGTASGLSGNTSGQEGSGPPGLTGTAPGLSGNTPGLSGTSRAPGNPLSGQSSSGTPGLTGTTPGLAGNTPGQSSSGTPGLTGTAPGLAGNTPGQSGSLPPGLSGTAPGLSGNTPAAKGR